MPTATLSRLRRSVQVLVLTVVVAVTIAAALPVETTNSTISASTLQPSATTFLTPSPKRGRKVNLPLILGLCLGLALPVWLFLGFLGLYALWLSDPGGTQFATWPSAGFLLPLGPFTLFTASYLRSRAKADWEAQEEAYNRRQVAAMRRRIDKP